MYCLHGRKSPEEGPVDSQDMVVCWREVTESSATRRKDLCGVVLEQGQAENANDCASVGV